ncbi:MAG: pro-sigmaK processing inhibitor BofA family protein [Oscillospiraceae bacterium]|nr:pro-sigmaK processing inhibitor BofA family protein [Oscillospiraceae bacterium]
MGKNIFYLLFLFCITAVLCSFKKSKKPVLSALKGMLSGGLSLIAVHFFGGQAGFFIPLNFFTAAVSLILGMPGVIIMALAERSGII